MWEKLEVAATLGLEVKLSVCWSLVRPSEEEERSVYKIDRVKPFHQAELVDLREFNAFYTFPRKHRIPIYSFPLFRLRHIIQIPPPPHPFPFPYLALAN